MPDNPYKFTGPLDPAAHEAICAPRNGEMAKVISGIQKGDYWSIIGPSQIGKTTLLKQLMRALGGFFHIYIDMESTPTNSGDFYEMILAAIVNNVPSESKGYKIKDFACEAGFFDFLKIFEPKEKKPIIFFFDEIEKITFVNSFLHLWRKIFHERDYDKNLKNYTVIAAGKAELSLLTAGEDADISPFNIAQTLYLGELSREDSEKIIAAPGAFPGEKITPPAQDKIVAETGGHPQLLQHLCHILIEDTQGKAGEISEKDVDKALEKLFLENVNLKALFSDIKTGKIPADLIKKILSGEKIGYLSYQELSITGSGPIVNEGRYCAIRNNIYKEFLKQVIHVEALPQKEEFKITVYFDEMPPDPESEEEHEFLMKLFKSHNKKIEISIEKNILLLKDLSFKEELTFCYLAYLNYKAIQHEEGISNWQNIPHTYRYFFSSSVKNNGQQIPEWEAYKLALKKIDGVEFIGESIKTWIFTLRKKLKEIGADGIIFSKPGRGSGYLLKGDVNFKIGNQK